MGSRVDGIVYSSVGLRLASLLARVAPPEAGYAFARRAARWISSRKSSSVAAVRSNQRMVSWGQASPERLDDATAAVFGHAADSVYELYHYMHAPGVVERMYCIDSSFEPILNRPEFSEQGLVIAGLHMAGFDLGLRWLCRYRFKPLVLTMPDPRAGRLLELVGRREMQMNVVSASMGAMRQAARHLEKGGMVLTGIDHPVPRRDVQPCFFGKSAALPTEHIYMALRADVPVVVVASRLEADGRYHVYASPLIEMDRHASRADQLILNAEKVLAAAGQFIAKASEQWLIFQPVWPG